MKRSQVQTVNRVTTMIIQVCIAFIILILAVVFIARGMERSFDLGYRVFNEPAVSPGSGLVMEYTVREGESVMEIATDLQKLGLIRDSRIMILQKYIYQIQIYPGTYAISTSMDSRDILERLSTAPEQGEN